MKDSKQVIAELVKNGAERVNDIIVKSVTVKEKEEWAQVILKVNKDVLMNVQNEDGDYTLGSGRTIFCSSFSIGAILGDMPEVALFKRMIMSTPEALETILSFAKISVLQEKVAEGTEYVNPFSSTGHTSVIQHDTVISHVIDIKLGAEGEDFIDMLRAEHRKAMIAKIMAGMKVDALRGRNRFVESNEEEAE